MPTFAFQSGLAFARKSVKMAVLPSSQGRAAVTHWRVLQTFGPAKAPVASLLACTLETGRTHQVRVHCSEMGCPILGEPMYGALLPAQRKAALHLHARGVVLPLSKNKPPIAVTAEPPEHMRAALKGRLSHDDLAVYNAVQKLLYLGVIIAGIIIVLSGLALWKPVQLQELTAVLGGYESARYVHFFAMAAIVGFLVIHIVMAFLVPKSLRAMIIGR